MPRKKKTGPQTPEDKLRVARNAVTHGMMSSVPVVLEFESVEQWEYHRNAIVEGFDPVGYVEVWMAEQIAILMWRLRRVISYETQAITLYNEDAQFDFISKASDLKEADRPLDLATFAELVADFWTHKALPEGDVLDRVKRHEAHLHRLWIQTMHELEARQARRRGGDAPLARLDITGLPGE
ncbi:MAG: hypothetical protein WD904_04570 [Dehalococcoidia bacterium]